MQSRDTVLSSRVSSQWFMQSDSGAVHADRYSIPRAVGQHAVHPWQVQPARSPRTYISVQFKHPLLAALAIHHHKLQRVDIASC